MSLNQHHLLIITTVFAVLTSLTCYLRAAAPPAGVYRQSAPLTVHPVSSDSQPVRLRRDACPSVCSDDRGLAAHRVHASAGAEPDPPNRGVSADAHALHAEACKSC